jgi:ADP-ribose pyrophosphatase
MKPSKRKGKWKPIEKRVIFKNQWICFRNDLVQRPDKEIVEYAMVDQRNYSAALCLTEDNKILMVNQFRYPWMQESWEVPSGLLNEGEDPKIAAKREILEETGYSVKSLQFLLKFHDVGFANGWGYLFFGRVRKGGKQKLDPNEFIDVAEIKLSTFNKMVENNNIIHSPTLLSLLIAKERGLIPKL